MVHAFELIQQITTRDLKRSNLPQNLFRSIPTLKFPETQDMTVQTQFLTFVTYRLDPHTYQRHL